MSALRRMCEYEVLMTGDKMYICTAIVSSFAVKHECKCSVCKAMPMVGFRSVGWLVCLYMVLVFSHS